MSNTRLELCYTGEQGSEYLDVVFSGEITETQFDALQVASNTRIMEGFIASQVGLPAPYDERISSSGPEEDDHVSTRFLREAFDTRYLHTSAPATDIRTISDFVAQFVAQSNKWDIQKEIERCEAQTPFVYVNQARQVPTLDENPSGNIDNLREVFLIRFDGDLNGDLIQNVKPASPGYDPESIRNELKSGQAVLVAKADLADSVRHLYGLLTEHQPETHLRVMRIQAPWEHSSTNENMLGPNDVLSALQVEQMSALMNVLYRVESYNPKQTNGHLFDLPEERTDRIVEMLSRVKSCDPLFAIGGSVLRDEIGVFQKNHQATDYLKNMVSATGTMLKNIEIMAKSLALNAPTVEKHSHEHLDVKSQPSPSIRR